MKSLPTYLTFLLWVGTFTSHAQSDGDKIDSYASEIKYTQHPTQKTHKLSPKAFRKALIAPAALTAVGLFAMTDNNFFSDNKIQKERNKYFYNFSHRTDDYLQYAPIVAVYGLNISGIKGQNNLANSTALLIKSEILVSVLSLSLKKITAVPRPDTRHPNSFPSGHTSQAFAAATFMHKEYGKISIWYSVGAYSVATTVGVMRVLNNRHWASDVLVGAGIGILSTNMIYLTHQYKWGKNPRKKGHQTMLLPTYGNGPGFYFNYKI